MEKCVTNVAAILKNLKYLSIIFGQQYILSILVYGFFNVDIKKIPCIKCRNHYVKYLAQHPISGVKNNLDLQKWAVDFHNDVNKRLGKPIFSFSEAKNLYS